MSEIITIGRNISLQFIGTPEPYFGTKVNVELVLITKDKAYKLNPENDKEMIAYDEVTTHRINFDITQLKTMIQGLKSYVKEAQALDRATEQAQASAAKKQAQEKATEKNEQS